MKHHVLVVLVVLVLPLAAWAQARPSAAPPPDADNNPPPAAVEKADTGNHAINGGEDLSPKEYANAFAELVAGNTELMAGKTGKPYLDESYVDEDGNLHIVITQAAALQFRREWPHTGTFVNIVNMAGPANPATSRTSSTTGAAGGSSTAINLPGFGMLDMADPNFINQVKQIRAINPEAFDQGFREGYQQEMAKYDPATQAFIEQLVPMNDGTSVEDALDQIGNLMQIYNTATGQN